MPAIRKIIPTQGREFWDSLDPNTSKRKQVLEAVTNDCGKVENSLRSPCKDLIIISNSMRDQTQIRFTTLRVDRAVFLHGLWGLGQPAMFPQLPDIPTPRRVTHQRSRTGNRNWLLISRQRRGPDRTMWERERYRHHGGTAGHMSHTYKRSAGKNTCREVKVQHQLYSYVRYSKGLNLV